MASFVFDQPAGTVEGFIDGNSIGSVTGVDSLNSHGQNIGIGATRQSSHFHDGEFSGDGHYFDGLIGEFLQYNRALSGAERAGVEGYLLERWLGEDVLAGGSGDDIFTKNNLGLDTIITNFQTGLAHDDVVKIIGFNISDYAELLTLADDQNGTADVVFNLDADDSLTLQGLRIADLFQEDFLIG